MEGKKFIVRDPKPKDRDDLINNYYSYYAELKEDPYFGIVFYRKKPKWKDEAAWFKSLYFGFKKGTSLVAVAESGGRAIGLCQITVNRPGSEMDHSGEFGIAIKKEYRSIGVGSAMMAYIISKSRKRNLDIVKLSVFSRNERAKALYRKMGFRKYGRIQGTVKRSGKYIDEDFMVLYLKNKAKA